GPISELTVRVDGEVDTQDTSGIVSGAIERFPPSLFLRETALTKPDQAITDLGRKLHEAARGETLKFLHLLLERLHADIVYDTGHTETATTAAEAFALGHGVC